MTSAVPGDIKVEFLLCVTHVPKWTERRRNYGIGIERTKQAKSLKTRKVVWYARRDLNPLTCPPDIDTEEMLQFSWTKGEGYGQEKIHC